MWDCCVWRVVVHNYQPPHVAALDPDPSVPVMQKKSAAHARDVSSITSSIMGISMLFPSRKTTAETVVELSCPKFS